MITLQQIYKHIFFVYYVLKSIFIFPLKAQLNGILISFFEKDELSLYLFCALPIKAEI
jgi:hypothetical protein